MAELVVRLRVAGDKDVDAALKKLGIAAQDVGVKLTPLNQNLRQTTDALDKKVEAAFRGRGAIGQLGQAIAGASAIASVFARNNTEMQKNLQTMSLTMSGASTALGGLRNVLSLVIGVIGAKIVIIGALIAAGVFLIRHWEQAKEIAVRVWGSIKDFFVRVFEGIANVFRGLGQIIVAVFRRDWDAVRAGVELMREGIGQLKDVAVDLGRGIKNLVVAGWEKLQDLFGQTGAKAKQAANNFQDFLKGLPIEAVQAWINMANRWEAAAASLLGALGSVSQAVQKVQKAQAMPRGAFGGRGGPFEDVIPDVDAIIEEARRLEKVMGPEFAMSVLDKAVPAFEQFGEKGSEAIRRILEELSRLGALIPETFGIVSGHVVDAAASIRQAWVSAIGDIAARSKSLGEFMGNLWETIKQTIIRRMAEAAAGAAFKWAMTLNLSKILPFPFNIVAGIFGLQHGGSFITRGPTPLVVGEGGEPEHVQVTPLSKAGRTGTTPTFVFNLTGPFLATDMEARRWARRVGEMYLEEIRR